MTTYAIWNDHAGKAQDANDVLAKLKDLGVTAIKLKDREALPSAIGEALSAGATTIIAAGGDGTISAVASELLNAKAACTLAILPLGTGNDLARSLNIPLAPIEAISLLEQAATRTIDVIEVCSDVRGGKQPNRTWMFNMATGGSSTRATAATTREVKRRYKVFAYLRNAYAAIKSRRTYKISWQLDHQRQSMHVTGLVIANGRTFGGGFEAAPQAELDDAKLDVIAIKDVNHIDIIRLGWRLITGTLNRDNDVSTRQGQTLTLDARPSMSFSVDGELGHRTPISFRVVPGALRVLVSPEGAVSKVAGQT